MYIETILAGTYGWGIEGGLRLGMEHGLGANDMILVAVSGFESINVFDEG